VPLLASVCLLLACSGSDEAKQAEPAPGGGTAVPEPTFTPGPILPCKDMPPLQALESPITPPGPGVPSHLGAFLGAWEGTAGGEHVGLVIMTVDAREAVSFYIYGPLRGRLVSQFRPDGSLHQGGNSQITFTWSFGRDPNVLESKRMEGNNSITYTMKKCTLEP
jgi:hypothetical protein